jgi:exopolysaccharide biosynthesis polyprenyl glycosylphosphotransferase
MAAVRDGSWRLASSPLFKRLAYLSADVLALLASYVIVSASTANPSYLTLTSTDIGANGYAGIPLLVAVLCLFRSYGDPDRRRSDRELQLVVKGVTVAFLVLFGVVVLLSHSSISPLYWIGEWYLSALVFIVVGRFCLRGLYGYLWKNGLARTRVLLMGEPERFFSRQNMLVLQRHRGYDTVGIISPGGRDDGPYTNDDIPVLGDLQRWEDVLRSYDVQLVVMAFPAQASYDVGDVITKCMDLGIQVTFFDALFSTSEFDCEIDSFTGTFHPQFKAGLSSIVHAVSKRILDIVLGSIGSMSVLLITPIIAAIIKLEDGGPIFYRSAYVGQDGATHYYLKFRSMCLDADRVLTRDSQLRKQFEHKFKLEADPRVTRIGGVLRKYSIDELPQFFSVFLGHLSLVGPRTIRQEETVRYGELLPKLLSCKPGVTGFWQVMGRGTTTYEERVQMDMFYIDHWSIWLDLVIVAKTFWTVLSAEGAY